MPPKRTKSPASARRRNKKETDSEASPINKSYHKLFRSIDEDYSGFIDAGELYDVIRTTFKGGENVTMVEVQQMMEEADVNDDGKLSYDEFVAIMSKAEVQSELWKQAQTSLLSRFQNAAQEASDVQDMITKDLRKAALDSAYTSTTSGLKLASGGIRLIAYLVELFVLGTIHLYGYAAYSNSQMIWNIVNRYTDYNYEIATAVQYGIFFFTCFWILSFWMYESALMCYGKTVGQKIFGLKVVYEKSKKPMGFLGMILLNTVFHILFPLELIFLLLSGRLISERLFDVVVVVS